MATPLAEIERLADDIEATFSVLPEELRPQRVTTDDGIDVFGASRPGFYADITTNDAGEIECYLVVSLETLRSLLSERQSVEKAVGEEREACAQAAEQQAREFLSPQYATGQPLSSFAERFACGEVARAIRARTAP